MQTIIDTSDLAEINGQDNVDTSMAATEAPDPKGISFHVSMRDWTLEQMEELVIEAAARKLLGKMTDTNLAKQIEAKLLADVMARADAKIAAIASDVMGHVLTPTSYGQKTPVTIGETLAFLGREYLDQHVNSEGKPTVRDSWNKAETRLEYFVRKGMAGRWDEEIKTATNAVVKQVRDEITARHKEVLATESKRMHDALIATITSKP